MEENKILSLSEISERLKYFTPSEVVFETRIAFRIIKRLRDGGFENFQFRTLKKISEFLLENEHRHSQISISDDENESTFLLENENKYS